MKSIPLQLVTVCLDDGQQGVFVGVPLVSGQLTEDAGQVEDIWFSDIQDVPGDMALDELMQLIQAQLCRCRAVVQ